MTATQKHIENLVEKYDRELLFGLRDKEKAMREAINDYHDSRRRIINDIIDIKGLVNENYQVITPELKSKIQSLREYAKRMKTEDKNSGIEKLLTHTLEFDNVRLFDWLYDELGKDQYRTFMVLLREAINDGGPGKGTAL